MMLRNNIFLSLFLIIAFSVMGKAQEINKEHPLPPPSLEDGDGVCHLRFDILILEVTVINREGYITNLRHEDFEVFYENRKHVVDFFTLGEILLKADNEEENISITNSITKYLIGIRPNNFLLDKEFEKEDFKVNISKEKRIKFRNPKIKIQRVLYQY